MGKNSFLGGGTILHAGSSFFSRDKNSKKSNSFNPEKDFLLRCIRSEIAGKAFPLRFEEPEKLQKIIIKSGGVSEWVKSHPEYSSLKKSELKRKKKKIHATKNNKNLIEEQNKKPIENEQKRQKKELQYLKDFIWAQLVGRAAPPNKPKGFSKQYPTHDALSEWAVNHESYNQIYREMSLKYEKKQAKLGDVNIKQPKVEIVLKKDIHKKR